MFSYFENGITDINPSRNIDLPDLVSRIRCNPEKAIIKTIRELKSRNDLSYKALKRTLPYITPNCIVRQRSLHGPEFDANFICPSGYIYIDIDGVKNAEEYRKHLTGKYQYKASLICVSPSGAGVTLLFKVGSVINKENFDLVRTALINSILQDEPVDPNSSGIGRAMFLSYDPELFVNYENQVIVDLSVTKNEKWESHSNSLSCSYNREKYPYSLNNKETTISDDINQFQRYKIYPIANVLAHINTKTIVPVSNPVVEFRPVDYAEVYIHKTIHDGMKHKTYYKLIHQLYYLNPDIEIDYLYSYLFFINNTRTRPKMEMRELVRFFNATISEIKRTGKVYPSTKIKYVHFNPSAGLNKSQKLVISSRLNGLHKISKTIERIAAAKRLLIKESKKITITTIAQLTKLDRKTVGKYINAQPIDMHYEVSLWN